MGAVAKRGAGPSTSRADSFRISAGSGRGTPAFGGHHNVLYRDAEGRERVSALEYPTLSELYQGLHARYDPADVLVIPHAHNPGDYRQSDPRLEPLIEMMSMHGTFEWFVRQYLSHGHQVGLVAASDDHLSHPGYSAPNRNSLAQRGGLGAVLAPEKSRDANLRRDEAAAGRTPPPATASSWT